MAAVAVSVDSRDCKTPGCAGESMHARGPYAGLCLACTATQRKRLAAMQREIKAARTPERVAAERAAISAGVRASAAARTASGSPLRDATRRLEQAAAQLERARRAEAQAMDAARKARAVRVAAEERIAELRRDLDAALGIVQGAPSS